ncbi:MAG: fructose-bisphosphate aldolase class I, partial [Gammaproteobacteria bacterium]
MDVRDQLQATVDAMVQPGKGILAMDESSPTIAKRFKAINVESTEENRRTYRSLILATPGLGEFISGIILFEETLAQQADDGTPLPELATRHGIVPGIKVDHGKLPLANAPGEEITEGLDGLAQRLIGYQQQGARFAKWRDVYHVCGTTPTPLAIETNAEVLARYAAICQTHGIVPIVEPEVLIDGDHSIDRCAEVTEAVLHEVFRALFRHHIVLEHMLLKPNMVIPGKTQPTKATPEEVARQTIKIFRRV